MKREEAIAYWKQRSEHIHNWLEENEDVDFIGEYVEAIDMEIEALHTDIVRCKDCKNQEHCHETVSHTKIHDDFQEHWSETIEWCSRGERKGGDSK